MSDDKGPAVDGEGPMDLVGRVTWEIRFGRKVRVLKWSREPSVPASAQELADARQQQVSAACYLELGATAERLSGGWAQAQEALMEDEPEAGWPCPAPVFVWLPLIGAWSACSACCRAAWAHEQADPIADLQAAVASFARTGEPPGPERAPAMRPGRNHGAQ